MVRGASMVKRRCRVGQYADEIPELYSLCKALMRQLELQRSVNYKQILDISEVKVHRVGM